MENLFEIASRKKYRFPYNGWIATEDLWDLHPSQLDSIYKKLNKDLKAQEDDSLMSEKKQDAALSNMVAIVKYIFTKKHEEAEARKTAAENAEKRQRIMEIIAQKDDESMKSMSKEKLLKKLEQLS